MAAHIPKIIALGGNAAHVPDHTMEACISAYTAGADGLMLTVQRSTDHQLILYGHQDLEVQTDGKGKISGMNLPEIVAVDAGARFSKGSDKPWAKNASVNRFIRLAQLDSLLESLEDNVLYFIRPGRPEELLKTRLEILRQVIELFTATSRVRPVIVCDSVALLEACRKEIDLDLLYALEAGSENIDLGYLIELNPSFVFCDKKKFDCFHGALNSSSIKAGMIISENDTFEKYPAIVVTCDVTKCREDLGMLSVSHTETWQGDQFDTGRWVAGISSGHTIMQDMLGHIVRTSAPGVTPPEYLPGHEPYDEALFCAQAVVNNGLHIKVIEGNTYASAGAVSRFSLGEYFVADVDFLYDNPQVANMMVLAVINQEVWPAYYHHPGPITNPTVMLSQNHVFDTHGAAPFVSMEREEKDGFRLMKYSSSAGIYEWYGNHYLGDVGNGASTRGKLRLERRGRFFSGYYQDENNSKWIGVGSLENASVNSRVYLRLGAKHYPKMNAPQPLQRLEVIFTNLIIRRPVGPLYQKQVSDNPEHSLISW